LISLNSIFKKIMELSEKDKFNIKIIFLFTAIFYSSWFLISIDLKAFLISDTPKLLTAGMNPFANTFKYWLHVFTEPVHGPLYRPISYYSFYYFIRKVFGLNIYFYYMVSFLLISLMGVLLYRWLTLLFEKRVSLLATIVFILYPVHLLMIYELSMPPKYCLPFALLLYQLIKTTENHEISNKNIVFMMLAQMLAIMSHEASFIFPVVCLLLLMTLRKKIKLKYILVALPSIVYCFARVFYWGIPGDGMFNVKPVLDSWIIYPGHLFSFQFITMLSMDYVAIYSGIIVFIILGVVALIFAVREKNFIPLFAIAAAVLLISPFSVLPGHTVGGREYWAILGPILIFAFLVQNVAVYHFRAGRRFPCVLVIGIFLFYAVVSNYRARGMSEMFMKTFNINAGKFHEDIKDKIGTGSEKTFILKIPDQVSAVTMKYPIPGLLALYFPEYTFLIPDVFKIKYKNRLIDYHYLILVKEGYCFYGRDTVKDFFNFPTANISIKDYIHSHGIVITEKYFAFMKSNLTMEL